jgi:hypothetical protein
LIGNFVEARKLWVDGIAAILADATQALRDARGIHDLVAPGEQRAGGQEARGSPDRPREAIQKREFMQNAVSHKVLSREFQIHLSTRSRVVESRRPRAYPALSFSSLRTRTARLHCQKSGSRTTSIEDAGVARPPSRPGRRRTGRMPGPAVRPLRPPPRGDPGAGCALRLVEGVSNPPIAIPFHLPPAVRIDIMNSP